MMFDKGTTTDKTRAEIERLRQARGKLQLQEQAARDELARLRATLGEAELAAFFEGGVSPAPHKRIAELEAEASGKASALAALKPRLVAAVRSYRTAQAAELRKPIPALLEKLARVRAAIEKHLAAADEEAGLPPGSHGRLPVDRTINTGTTKDGHLIMLGPPQIVPLSVDEAISSRIGEMESQAAALEARPVVLAGQVTGNGLTELLEAVASVELFAPAIEAIEAWFRGIEQAAEAEWTRLLHEDFPEALRQSGIAEADWRAPEQRTMFTLKWDENGTIAAGSCFNNLAPAVRMVERPPAA